MALTFNIVREPDRTLRVGYGGSMADEEKAQGQPAGIVVTDADGKGGQGFVPAEVAEAAGVRVTGSPEAERASAEESDAAGDEADTPKRATKKASRKK